MSIPTAPAIGSRVRITERWPQGTKIVTEGIYTGWCEPDWELDHHARVPFSAAGHCVNGLEGMPLPVVTIEILELPEPADGSWLTVPSSVAGRPPYVFHRDDSAKRYEWSPEYRWWFHEDGEWVTWAEIQKRGEVTVIKDGGVQA